MAATENIPALAELGPAQPPLVFFVLVSDICGTSVEPIPIHLLTPIPIPFSVSISVLVLVSCLGNGISIDMSA